MNLFYQQNIHGDTVHFDAEESRHIVRVLRRKSGDEVLVTDGMGKRLTCILNADHPKRCEAKIIHTELEERRDSCRIHLAVAPTKNISRYEWFLEKATEIGVDEITPIICRNSERNQVKIERLNKVLIAAMKQSLKVHLPVLHPAVSFNEFIKKAASEQKYIASIGSGNPVPIGEIYKKGKTNVVLIGPEGDFADEEVADAAKVNYLQISLGKSRLRTETAGVVACHTISLLENV